MKKYFAVLVLVSAALCVGGCKALNSTLGRYVTKTPVLLKPAETNLVTLYKTNVVTTTEYLTNTVTTAAVVSNGVVVVPATTTTQVLTNTVVQPVITSDQVLRVLQAVYGTNYGVDPKAVQSVQSAANQIPVPWASQAGSLLATLLGVGFGAYSTIKNKQLANQKRTWVDTAVELTKNVDIAVRADTLTPEGKKAAMDAIRASQAKAGVKHAVELALSGVIPGTAELRPV